MDGEILINDFYNNVTMFGLRNIFDHMVVKDCYEAGLMSEDEWKSYLKRLIKIYQLNEDRAGDEN